MVVFLIKIFLDLGRMNNILDQLDSGNYQYLYEERVDSICLKGITNSYSYEGKITLEQKYIPFCKELLAKLKDEEMKDEGVTYDILGDDDFRLIARNVSLGKLLEQFCKNGCLGYYAGNFRFYLYSSSLVLNTKNETDFADISPLEKTKAIEDMEEMLVPKKCLKLESEMIKIKEMIRMGQQPGQDEKKATFCQAVWKLLQSIKVLEAAPTKSYDFDSIYRPFAMLVCILEEKMDNDDLAENALIYEFVHKISTILHGTLRNDIQFFQIRDFNAIVHYAPAKLRAFYSLWALRLADFYNSLSTENHRYAFVLAPGLFGDTQVRQLFPDDSEKQRLMLITIPERHLYTPGLLCIVLSHETSHFSGSSIRNRRVRHNAWINSVARVLQLEWCSYVYLTMGENLKDEIQDYITKTQSQQSNTNIMNEIIKWVNNEECAGVIGNIDFHSGPSRSWIKSAFSQVAKDNTAGLVEELFGRLRAYLIERCKKNYTDEKQVRKIRDICVRCNCQKVGLTQLTAGFISQCLSGLLDFLKYLFTEPFADVMAIMTLRLKPSEYVSSYVQNEWHEIDEQEKSVPIFVVRISLVMVSMNRVAKKKSTLKEISSDFAEYWKGNWLQELIATFPADSHEFMVVCQIKAYLETIKECHSHLSEYSGLYNIYEKEFNGEYFPFLMDKIIVDDLVNYLVECADLYIDGLAGKKALKDEQKEILDIYHAVSCGTPMLLAQQIENLLARYAEV